MIEPKVKFSDSRKPANFGANFNQNCKVSFPDKGIYSLFQFQPPSGSMDMLVQFIKDNRMRLTDIFFRFDKDRNDKISKVEFVKGLMNAGLKMDKVITLPVLLL